MMVVKANKIPTGGSGAAASRLVGSYDMVLMAAVLALTGIGLLLVLSTTVHPSLDMSDGKRFAMFNRQALAVLIGFAAMIVVRLLTPELLGKPALVVVLASAVLISSMKQFGFGPCTAVPQGGSH